MTKEKKYTWHKIAESSAELTQSGSKNLATVKVAGKEICIAYHTNGIFGCTAKCPHAGAILSEGWLDALGNIVCPLHRYKYNMVNGRNISGEGYFLKTYPVIENEDGVFVGIEIGIL